MVKEFANQRKVLADVAQGCGKRTGNTNGTDF